MRDSEISDSTSRKFFMPSKLGGGQENSKRPRISRNLRYKILAILLAIVLWFYAANERGVIHDRVFDNIPIAVRSLESGLVLTEELPRVQITLRGSTEGLNVNELTAYVDLSRVQSGETVVPVQVNVPGGVTFVSVKPSRVKVTADVAQGKQVPVEIKLTGQAAPGWLAMSPTVTPSQVVITGGKNILGNVQSAFASLDLRNTERNLNETVSVKVFDRDGALVEGLQIVPANVEIFVPVIKEQPMKAVPVKAVVNGLPAAGYQVSGISVEPQNVKVIGVAEDIEKVKEVLTLPIDISGSDKTVAYLVRLELPPGITGFEPSQVSVVVQVARENLERDLGPVRVQIEDLASGQQADYQSKEVTVRVAGSPDMVEKLITKDVSARVNLSGLSAGKYEVPVSVSLPSGITLVRVTPDVLTVTLVPETKRPE